MKLQAKKHSSGFTLVELMVVIAIMILMAAMAIPAMSDFLRSRHLRSAGSLVQGVCMQARSRAIAQREEQYVIFFVTTAAYVGPGNIGNVKTDQPGLIRAYDSNESLPNPPVPTPPIEDSDEFLPEMASFVRPATNFSFTFEGDGTIVFNGIGDLQDDPEEPGQNNTDMVIQQEGSDLRCYVDVTANTGRVRFEVREPE